MLKSYLLLLLLTFTILSQPVNFDSSGSIKPLAPLPKEEPNTLSQSLLFAPSQNAALLSEDFFDQRDIRANVGIGLYSVGFIADYAVAVPLLAKGDVEGWFVTWGSSPFRYAGAITTGVSATKATRGLRLGTGGKCTEKFSWWFFSGGMVARALGQFTLGIAAYSWNKKSYIPSLFFLAAGDALMIAHLVRAKKAIGKSRQKAEEYKKEVVEFSLSPVVVPKGGGLFFSVHF